MPEIDTLLDLLQHEADPEDLAAVSDGDLATLARLLEGWLADTRREKSAREQARADQQELPL